jgi:hypothetical protein
MRRQILEKAVEFLRKEASRAVPAAKRAASHAGKEFLKKFSQEYTEERKKR